MSNKLGEFLFKARETDIHYSISVYELGYKIHNYTGDFINSYKDSNKYNSLDELIKDILEDPDRQEDAVNYLLEKEFFED